MNTTDRTTCASRLPPPHVILTEIGVVVEIEAIQALARVYGGSRSIRTTNPIESTFATVRLRTRRTKGCGSRIACLTMVFRLTQCAERHWRALNSAKLLADVIRGVPFIDGEKKLAA